MVRGQALQLPAKDALLAGCPLSAAKKCPFHRHHKIRLQKYLSGIGVWAKFEVLRCRSPCLVSCFRPAWRRPSHALLWWVLLVSLLSHHASPPWLFQQSRPQLFLVILPWFLPIKRLQKKLYPHANNVITSHRPENILNTLTKSKKQGTEIEGTRANLFPFASKIAKGKMEVFNPSSGPFSNTNHDSQYYSIASTW